MHPLQNNTAGGGDTNNENLLESSENDVIEQQVDDPTPPPLFSGFVEEDQGDQLVPTMPEADREITPPTPKKPKPSIDVYETGPEDRRSAARFLFNWSNAAPSGEEENPSNAALSMLNWSSATPPEESLTNAALSGGEQEESSNSAPAPAAGQLLFAVQEPLMEEAPDDEDFEVGFGRPLSPPLSEPRQWASQEARAEFQNRLLDSISRRSTSSANSQTDSQSVEDVLQENVLVDLTM